MRIHGYVHTPQRQDDAWLRAVGPMLDMLEVQEAALPRLELFDRKPNSKLICYKVITFGWQGAMDQPARNAIYGMPVPDVACLHHLDGRVWEVPHIPGLADYYGPPRRAPGTHPLIDPRRDDVWAMVEAEVARLRDLGYDGWRYDEIEVGGFAPRSIDFADCREYATRESYLNVLEHLCRRIKALGWMQLPSLHNFWEPTQRQICTACSGISAEDFPSGDGLYQNYAGFPDVERARALTGNQRIYWVSPNKKVYAVGTTYESLERTIRGVAALGDWMRRSSLKYDVMFFTRTAKGLGAITDLIENDGGRVYWNVDALRRSDGTVEGLIS